MNWRKMFGLHAKPDRLTMEDLERIRERLIVDREREDRLFDEYLSIPDRPKIAVPTKKTSATDSPITMAEVFDYGDWCKWKKNRQSE